MKKMNKLLSIMMAMAMVIAMLPTVAMAADAEAAAPENAVAFIDADGDSVYDEGEVTYTDIHNAFYQNRGADELRVVLLKSFSYDDVITAANSGTVYVEENGEYVKKNVAQKVTFDLCGFTFTSSVSDGAAIKVMNGASLTIIDSVDGGKIVAAGDGIKVGGGNAAATLTVTGGTIEAEVTAIDVTKNSTLTIDGGNIVGGKYGAVLGGDNSTIDVVSGTLYGETGISSNASYAGTTVSISGGTVEGEKLGIYHPQQGDLNISGGTVTGKTGIAIKSGNLNVTAGAIEGTGEKADYTFTAGGFTSTGDAIVIESVQSTTSNYEAPTASISGGTITSTNASAVSSQVANESKDTLVTNFISGGTFSVAPAAAYLADGYAVQKNGEYVEVVPASTIVAPPENVGEIETKVDSGESTGSSDVSTEGMEQDEAKTATDAAAEIVTNISSAAIENATSEEKALEEAVQNSVNENAAAAALEAAGLTDNTGSTDPENVYIHVETSLDITVTDVEVSESNANEITSITVDITPVAKVIASTMEDKEHPEFAENSVVVSEAQEIEVTKPVTISIPLPGTFAIPADGKIYIVHTKTDDNGNMTAQYVYEATVTGDSQTGYVATFTNPNGFSMFTARAAQPMCDVDFTIPEGASIVIKKDGQTVLTTATGVLPVGTYTYEVSKRGYVTAIGSFDLTTEGYADTVTLSVDVVEIWSVKVAETENGGVAVSNGRAAGGSKITITAKPDAGYQVADVTVTCDGDEIAVRVEDNGKYSFRMPDGAVVVNVTFEAAETAEECDGGKDCPTNHLTDVDHDQWYHSAVDYAVSNGLMSGISADKFAPEATMDRSMVIQVLYNMEGNPAVTLKNAFSDVAADKWYANAIQWGVDNGILTGYGTAFDPTGAISREEMVRMMYNYAEYKGMDTSARGDLSVYTDGATTSDWAVEYVQWAVGSGVMVGGNTILNPTGSANRAEVAQIFKNFHEIYG